MLSKNCREVHPGHTLATLPARLKRALGTLGRRYRHRREMRQLLELEPHRLTDIGLRREDAERYARWPLWRRMPFEER